ncbi:hypothetical protein Cgig2_031473 [Carnegiea gigantea]|uniref:Pectinesterase n=1 Tax=Carnegiea gigantea TaxID=171969 RepID=A0A9Q1JNJ9_9CARY|nr:hypothetical protein Cgig2_031473 [Carnegiea gigantea]
MKGKIIGLVVSIILIVGLAISLVFGIRLANKSSNPSNNPLYKSSKGIAAVCNPTDYKDVCAQSLNTLSNNETATPEDYLQVAINVTIDAINEGIAKSAYIGQSANDSLNRMGFQDCKELLQLAIHELEATSADIRSSNAYKISERINELKNWLSAAVAYKEACLDGVDQRDLKELMTRGLANSTQLISNLLAIVSDMDQILDKFDIKRNKTLSYRRLLNVGSSKVTLNNGYPSWFSAAERKLLGRINTNNPNPNVVVASDGSGQFRTISAALAAYPKNLQGRYVIYVKAGIYDEQVLVTKDQVNVFMYGDGPRKTIITGRKNYAEGVSTYQTATLAVIGNRFIGKSMGFQNTAGPQGHQAVALRVQSDMAAFYNCRMDGYQDTLYAQAHRQFYRNCVISGTIDFIFGDGNAFIQNSLVIVRRPMDGQQNTVTAQGKTDSRETTGIVIHNCRVVPEQKLFPIRITIQTYLGRPWKKFSTVIFMQSTLADFINPAGWLPWSGNFALDTLFFAEFANQGPGADTSKRVRWKGYHVISNPRDALRFTIDPFIQGNEWIPASGTPFLVGLKH